MSDVLVADPEFEKALPLDPFGSHPQWSSRIVGLGGHDIAPDPSYVFLTLDSRPAIGRVSIRICFVDLVATLGTLLIEIRVRSAFPGSEPSRLQTVTVDLRHLVEAGGIVELSFESYRNAYYAVAGSINDETDASASHVSIMVNRRATPTEHGKQWGWRAGQEGSVTRRPDIESALIGRSMTDLAMPRLDMPMSQVGSPLQCREDGFAKAMNALRRDPAPTIENWSLAYVLQAIARFDGTQEPRKMLGYVADESPLLSYFASKEHEIVGIRHVEQCTEQPDPGRELERMWMPELCDEANYFAHAHFTTGDIRLHFENFRDQFDILWSIGANQVMSSQELVYFVVNGLSHVKPCGLAVHVFDYSENAGDDPTPSLSRYDIERMAALALAHGNDVARLQFRHGAANPEPGSRLPFGMVLLRGGMPD